jgi:hypothetical protein
MRTPYGSVTQWPSWLYQRYSQAWTRLALSLGWAALYVLCDAGVGAFSTQWRAVFAVCIFVAGLFRPALAYAAFILAVAYPLYLISIYVMALALAALILSLPLVAFGPSGPRATRGVGAMSPAEAKLCMALMVISAPLLAPIHLASTLPLLAGLWWGGTAGALVGGLAAAWLKVSASMSGASADLWRINGWSLSYTGLYARFHTANSLQTVVRTFGPLVSDSVAFAEGHVTYLSGGGSPLFPGAALLFNLLQVLSWALAGYAVGVLMGWLRRNRGWRAALSLGPGTLSIWMGYVAVPSWLQVDGPRWAEPRWLPVQVVLASVVAWGLDGLVGYLAQPIASGRRRVPVRSSRSSIRSSERRPGRGRRPESRRADPLDLLTPYRDEEQAKPKPKAKDQEDIIMIELD